MTALRNLACLMRETLRAARLRRLNRLALFCQIGTPCQGRDGPNRPCIVRILFVKKHRVLPCREQFLPQTHGPRRLSNQLQIRNTILKYRQKLASRAFWSRSDPLLRHPGCGPVSPCGCQTGSGPTAHALPFWIPWKEPFGLTVRGRTAGALCLQGRYPGHLHPVSDLALTRCARKASIPATLPTNGPAQSRNLLLISYLPAPRWPHLTVSWVVVSWRLLVSTHQGLRRLPIPVLCNICHAAARSVSEIHCFSLGWTSLPEHTLKGDPSRALRTFWRD